MRSYPAIPVHRARAYQPPLLPPPAGGRFPPNAFARLIALFLLILNDPGQLPLDALKLVCAHRDRPQGSAPQAGEVDKGQLKGNGAVEIIEEIAPAIKDGLLVLVVRELVVDVPELDGFCEVIPCHLTNAILPHEQIRNAVLRRLLLFICALCL